MATIAELQLPASDTLLEAALEHAPDASFELESVVSKTPPSIWVAGVGRARAETAFDSDPEVEAYELLVETSARHLFDVDFVAGAGPERLCDVLLADGGSLLEARGTNGWWRARARFPDRGTLCDAYDRLVDRGVNADLRRLTDVTDVAQHTKASSQLTPQQREALEAALEYGYFEIPRAISMAELADELGISHQALSERFRRAYETLVDEELQPTAERSLAE